MLPDTELITAFRVKDNWIGAITLPIVAQTTQDCSLINYSLKSRVHGQVNYGAEHVVCGKVYRSASVSHSGASGGAENKNAGHEIERRDKYLFIRNSTKPSNFNSIVENFMQYLQMTVH